MWPGGATCAIGETSFGSSECGVSLGDGVYEGMPGAGMLRAGSNGVEREAAKLSPADGCGVEGATLMLPVGSAAITRGSIPSGVELSDNAERLRRSAKLSFFESSVE